LAPEVIDKDTIPSKGGLIYGSYFSWLFLIETYAAFTLSGFDEQERNLTFVKQLSKF